MALSCEVKRTLVKSPPELWSELSDPSSLARHLDGVGEIRITRSEPETAVEWEADGASGSVRLEPSGFGTKVTLSLSRQVAEPAATAEPESIGEPQPVVEPEPIIEPEPAAEPEPTVEAEPLAEPEPVPDSVAASIGTPEPATVSRGGFFARLFKRRRQELSRDELPPMKAEPVVAEPEPRALVEPEEPQEVPVEPEPEPEPAAAVEAGPEPETAAPPMSDEAETADFVADLAALEAKMAEQDQAMLTAMLDRLGAAHHRPFSRA